MTRHFCNLWCDDHPDKSITHRTLYIVITVLFPIVFPMLYFKPHVCFLTMKLYCLSPSPFSPIPPNSLSFWQVSECSLYLQVCFYFICSCIVFLDFTYKWNYIVFVFLWLISFRILPSEFIHVVADDISFFFDWVILHCIHHCFFIHSFTDRHLGCYLVLAVVNNAAMNIWMHASSSKYFWFLWMNIQNWNCWVLLCLLLQPFLKNLFVWYKYC